MHSISQHPQEVKNDSTNNINNNGDDGHGHGHGHDDEIVLSVTRSSATPTPTPTPTTNTTNIQTNGQYQTVAAHNIESTTTTTTTTNNATAPSSSVHGKISGEPATITTAATTNNNNNNNKTSQKPLTKTQSLRSSIPSFIPTSQVVKLSSKMNRLKDLFSTPTQSSTNLPGSINKSTSENDGHNFVFKTAKEANSLFPATDPQVDGEECLHDCDSCTVSLPRKWDIDNSDELYGHVKGWDYHLIVGTGKTDWVRDVVDEKGSLMESLGIHGLEIESRAESAVASSAGEDQQQHGKGSLLKRKRVMLSASNMPTGGSEDGQVDASGKTIYGNDGKTNVVVLPGWTMVEGVGRGEVGWLMNDIVGSGPSNLDRLSHRGTPAQQKQIVDDTPETNTEVLKKEEPVHSSNNTQPELAETKTNGVSNNESIQNVASEHPQISSQPLIPSGIKVRTLQHKALILMCSHKTRDARCGQSAPLLRREFERHLRPLGLYRDLHDDRPGGVGIYFINHVGGHKYSANVMVYRRQGSGTHETGFQDEAVQGIWLARVRPEDCENIVRYTVLQGKVVKPTRQLRGGFDRGSGVASW